MKHPTLTAATVAALGMLPMSGALAEPASRPHAATQPSSAATHSVLDAERLIGMPVSDMSGQTIGEVNDVVLDTDYVGQAIVVGLKGRSGDIEREIKLPIGDFALEQGDGGLALTGLYRREAFDEPAYVPDPHAATYKRLHYGSFVPGSPQRIQPPSGENAAAPDYGYSNSRALY